MNADPTEEVRDHIKAGGEYRTEIAEGLNFATGQSVIGLRISTRGRVKPLSRWRKEFTFYAKDDQTLDDLHRFIATWSASAPEGSEAP